MTLIKTKETKPAKADKKKFDPMGKNHPAPRTVSPKQARSLCVTCSKIENCIYRTAGKPVHHCEEYDGIPGAVAPEPMSEPIKRSPESLQGLCINCAHRESCSLKTQGGVWHCEEFEMG